MAKQGAALQTYNNELVKCLEQLCERRKGLQGEIDAEEQTKSVLEAEMRKITSKLDKVNESLAAKLEKRDRYDKTITESEQAYLKILESSQVLLNVVQKDTKKLNLNDDSAAGNRK